MPEFIIHSFFTFEYKLPYIAVAAFSLAFLTLYFTYVGNILTKGPTAIHKTTLVKYIIIFVGFIIYFGILVYSTFVKKIDLYNNQVDCFLVNLSFLIIYGLIVVFIIQVLQDLIKTYKDKIDYKEYAEMAKDPQNNKIHSS